MDFHDRYSWAEILFGDRRYDVAARELEALLAEVDQAEGPTYGLAEARLLLARSYYHAAHLRKAEAAARELLADNPVDAYAALLLYRSLQRQSKHEEAQHALTLASVLGAPGTTWEDEDEAEEA